jgi:hypothetical protein
MTVSIVANASIETACIQLQQLKGKIKEFEEAEDGLKEFIQSWMKEKATVTAYDGSILATWKTAKPSKRFSVQSFLKVQCHRFMSSLLLNHPVHAGS